MSILEFRTAVIASIVIMSLDPPPYFIFTYCSSFKRDIKWFMAAGNGSKGDIYVVFAQLVNPQLIIPH